MNVPNLNFVSSITTLKEKLNDAKLSLPYIAMLIAGTVMLGKYLFNGRKSKISHDEKSKKRRKIGKKSQRFFNIKSSSDAVLKYSKEQCEVDSYSKLIDYTGTMMSKVLTKDEVAASPRMKQELIFYQILSGMQDRFKKGNLQGIQTSN